MPGITFMKIFMLFGIVSAWAENALEDGKITLTEAAGLAEKLGPVLGIPVEIEVPAPLALHSEPAPGDEIESAADESVAEEPTDESPPHKPIGGYPTEGG